MVDAKPLDFYNIGEGAELPLLSRLRGGLIPVVRFADISNSSNMQVLEWVSNGPEWRMAQPGLCVEGHCLNPSCAANSKTVICNRGMGVFDLVLDARRVACPICLAYVEPQTCAFNNCEWRFSGTKVGRTAPHEVRSLDWTVAGDQYNRFSSQPARNVNWNRLLISTRTVRGTSSFAECSICLVDLTDSRSDAGMVTNCGHRYHVSCIEAWKAMGHRSCPMCRVRL